MFLDFKKHIESNLSVLSQSRLLIAISGGIDSVALAHLCDKADLNFALAHCNFGLRGAESDTDETFVLELAELLNVEVFVQRFDTEAYAKTEKLSIQMAARELRYNWFKEITTQLGFDYTLTAHHADDNLETFLINFTRGTGLNGLTGIPMMNDNIIRPLLPFSRDEIESYATNNKLQWRDDSSNVSRKYLRNKLRHDVVPILKEINPQLLDSFQNTLNNLSDTADIVEESLNAVAKRAIVSIDEQAVVYKVSEFIKVNNPKAYLFEMFKDYGFAEWNDVLHLLDGETGKYVTSSTHRLTRHRQFLILTDLYSGGIVQNFQAQVAEALLSGTKNTSIQTPMGLLKFQLVSDSKLNTKDEIFIDKAIVTFPLMIRPWQSQDVFQPIGMKGTKTLSKYLKDEKLMPLEKENTLVLTTADNQIVWVIGMRADDRFKITDRTKQVLKINYL